MGRVTRNTDFRVCGHITKPSMLSYKDKQDALHIASLAPATFMARIHVAQALIRLYVYDDMLACNKIRFFRDDAHLFNVGV